MDHGENHRRYFTHISPAGQNTADPITAQGVSLSQGIQPIREAGNAAHVSRAFWVAPAGVVLIMI